MDEGRLYFWGARVLYLGPAYGLTPHRNAVAVLCAAVASDFEVASDPLTPNSDYIACQTALIPPSTLHHLRTGDQPMAFLYVDAQSDDYATLRASMSRVETRVAFEIAGAAAYLDTLAQLSRGLPWNEGRERIVSALRLAEPKARDERIAEAIRHLHLTPSDVGSLSEVAARSGLSASRFLHLFKEMTGVPFRRYRLWAQMGAAVRGMVNGHNLTEAAHTAGFSSSSHFSTAFRQMFGMPPSLLGRFNLSIVECIQHSSSPSPLAELPT